MKRWFWIIGFAAVGMGVSPVSIQIPGNLPFGPGPRAIPEIIDAVGPESRSKHVARIQLSQIGNIDLVRMQVAADEQNLPKDGNGRLNSLVDLTRFYFMLGEMGAKDDNKPERQKYYEKGHQYAELVICENPERVEGHYWLALNLLGLADVRGAGRALLTLPNVVEELITARGIDKAYDQAGPDRILGRLYLKAPSWPISVGDVSESLKVLRAAVKIAPENSTNHLFLAETLLDMNKKREAYQELKKVLSSTSHSIRVQGLEEDRQQALILIKK